MVHQRYKKDLAGQLGNLAMRCAAPKINPTMAIPSLPSDITEAEAVLDKKLRELAGTSKSQPHNLTIADTTSISSSLDLVKSCFEEVDFSRGLEHIFDCVSEANKYWDSCKPWKVVESSDANAQERMQTILYYAFETLRITGLLLQPVLPDKMRSLLDGISVEEGERAWENARLGRRWKDMDVSDREWVPLPKGQVPLFPKL